MPSELEKLVAELRAVAAEAEKLRPRLVRHAGLVREFAAEIAADPDGRSMSYTQAASLLHQAGRQCDALAAELGRAKVAADHFAGRVLSGGGPSSADVTPAPVVEPVAEPARDSPAGVDTPPAPPAVTPPVSGPAAPDGEPRLPPYVPYWVPDGAPWLGRRGVPARTGPDGKPPTEFSVADLSRPEAAGTEPKGGYPREPRTEEEARERERPAVPPARVPVTDTSREVVNKFVEAGYTSPDCLPKALVDERSFWMDQGGHAILRHAEIPDSALMERALLGKDPITGTKVDWDTGREHSVSRHATTFTSRAALVFAEAKAWDRDDARAERADATAQGRVRCAVTVPAAEIFGSNRQPFKGWTRLGSAKNPRGVEPTTLDERATIRFVYAREPGSNNWVPYSIYPEPHKEVP
jgi:hypothetical protein